MDRYLLKYIDNISKKEGTSRSAVIRNIIRGLYGGHINEDQRGRVIHEEDRYKKDMYGSLHE